MNYQINSVDKETGIPNITYTTEQGNLNTESLANARGLTLEELHLYMIQYCKDYDNGVNQARVPVHSSIQDAIGQSFGVTVDNGKVSIADLETPIEIAVKPKLEGGI